MPTDEIAVHFTGWDWAVVVFYMVLTTWVGHRLSGKSATVKDFFLGGRTMPWWAVSGSMIATEISALTDYQIAQVDIAFATGTVLGATNVDWQPVAAPKPQPDVMERGR